MKRHTVEVLTKVVEIQTAIAANLNVAHIMQIVTESAEDITGATGAAVEIADGEDMVYRAASGICLGHVGVRLKIATSLSGLCVRTGVTQLCSDSDSDNRVDRAACRQVGLRSMLVVPLLRNEKTIGVLKVMSEKPNAFNEEDAEILVMMAGFIASAMHNAAEFEHSQYRAMHDGLTGLPNRILFRDRVSQGLALRKRHGTNLAVLYIDLDGFKPVNDKHGHDAGDQLLIAVADRMRHAVRAADTVARLGGDEFAVLVVDIKKELDLDQAIERLRSSLEDHPFDLNCGRVTIGASVGVAMTNAEDLTTDSLLNKADLAMYATKRKRKAEAALVEAGR